MLVNRQVILVEVETTYGTDPNPLAADAVLVQNVNFALEGLRMNDRPSVRSSLGTLQQIYGGALKAFSFDVEIKGSGTNDVPPECGALLRACGMDETIVASTSVTYTPASTSHDSVTIYFYQDEDGNSVRHRVNGCRGSVSFNFTVGEYPVATFTMVGHLDDETDQTTVTPTYDTTVPVPFINATGFLIGAFAGVINSLTFDLSNTVSTPPDVLAADGYAEIQITKRDVNGVLDPELELAATFNPWTQFRAGTTLVLDTGTIGSVAGNRMQISFPAIYWRDQTQEDREGVLAHGLPFGAAETASENDEVSIQFT